MKSLLSRLFLMLDDHERETSRRETATFAVGGICAWLELDAKGVERIGEAFAREIERKYSN